MDERRVAEDRTGDLISEFASAPLDVVAYAAPIVIEATVVGVDGPFWNSRDGQKWQDNGAQSLADGADYTIPVMYREVHVKVTDTLRDDWSYVTDDLLTFVALGGGAESEDPDKFAAGAYAIGESLMLFLSVEPFYMRERPVTALQPFFLSDGVYHIEKGEAVKDEGSSESAASPLETSALRTTVGESRSIPRPALDHLLRSPDSAALWIKDVLEPRLTGAEE